MRRRFRTSVVAACVTAAALIPAAPSWAEETTPPTINVATLSPSAPTGQNNWYRGPVTLNMSATDDVGIDKFQYSLNGGAAYIDVPVAGAPASATASAVITQEGNTSVRYRAVDTAGNVAAFRSISVRIDTRAPAASYPVITDGHVGHVATLIPTRTDPAPGSGGVAVLNMYLDGKLVPPLPVQTSDLSLGVHTLAVHLSDAASNSAKYTQTFIVTTSFADAGTLIARFVTAGSVPAEVGAALQAKLDQAKALADAGSAKRASQVLHEFVSIANSRIKPGSARSTLVGDARYLIDQLNGRLAPEPATGLKSEPAEGPKFIPDPVLAPLPHNPDADYNVLVFSKTTGFRHDHIPHTVAAIQKLGIAHHFNVDVYDPQLPTVTLPTSPFLSLDTLKQYDTIVFESNVGHPGPLDAITEQPNFEAYMKQGGGYVGIHGAADSFEIGTWPWYGDLVGGFFTGHPNGQNGFGQCGSCIHTEVVTEDNTHPATAHLPARWMTVDELYNFDRNMRADVHTLLSLNEDSYQRSLNSGNAATNPLRLMNGDHPIAWCQNWDGGKAFSLILGHFRTQYYDDSFMRMILGGIETTAGRKSANCSSYRETSLLIEADRAAGLLTADAADAAGAALGIARDSYLATKYTSAIPALNSIVALANNKASGDAAARSELARQARELREWMQNLNRR
ncbi:ThuA domain-containing protein [Microbispora sp. RL4-1S]|uniref:ThuA domain-containing protein n=1 Tax=Microbispora oryzae TaxID=2806554 RepID=A0A940WG47_9ACTN|nr:ThuA domain-containing protein [Microbispora oryzae]MBP2705019.1 ThuA domain-containing protein [Microbispora oryzae]